MIFIGVLIGIVAILWIVFDHRSSMEHLRARRDGSLDRDEYHRGVKDGLLKAAKLVDSHVTGQSAYVGMIRAAAGEKEQAAGTAGESSGHP